MTGKLFSVILVLAVLFAPVPGSQITVLANADARTCYVDETARGLNNGSSWVNAFTSLQSGLGDLSCTILKVAEGTYYPTGGSNRSLSFNLRSGLRVSGGFPNGGGTADPSANKTILSGDIGVRGDNSDNSYHVVTATNVDTSAILDGFTIQDGRADNDSPPTDRGGGAYIEGSSPTLQRLVISGNTALEGGYGIYLLDSSPSFTDVVFINNDHAPDGSFESYGAGLWSEGNSNPILTRVNFTNNYALTVGGGFFSTGSPRLTDVEFSGNSAGYDGGGMYSSGDASLTRVIFKNNNSGSNAGGLYANSGNITIRNSQFLQNESAVGGGLSVYGNITMIDGVIDENSGRHGGGGLFLSQNSSGDFINLIVTHNKSLGDEDAWSGGILTFASPVNFTNLLLSGNTAYRCSGMANVGSTVIANATMVGNHAATESSALCINAGTTLMTNAIVWGNTGAVPGPDVAAGPQLKAAYSIFEHGCPVNATCSKLVTGNPRFLDPANGNYHLQIGSPAINTGNTTALPNDAFDLDGDGNTTEKIPFDLGGSRRVVRGQVDLGAYEAGIPVFLPVIQMPPANASAPNQEGQPH